MTFKKEGVVVTIRVHEGKLWNLNFILKSDSMIERRTQITDSLRIDKIQISKPKQAEDGSDKTLNRIKVTLGGDYDDSQLRLHAWAF